MKTVVGIFMAMVMVFLMIGMAFGEELTEVTEYCNDHGLEEYVVCNATEYYNIICDCAYTIGSIGDAYEDMYDFMNGYREYLKKYWPEFEKDVKIEYTFAGMTEHYTLVCVWLTLDNGKLMSDYLVTEPAVKEISAIIPCNK